MSRMSDTGNAGNPAGRPAETAQQVGQNLRELGGQVRDAAREKYEQLSEQANQYYEQGREKAQEWEEGLESYVREKPIQSLLIAAGVGMLLGVLWKRS
ncbi:MAG: hypothetical protein JWL69_3914 [Phycisphaerales bacterium]|nr:hypothetical protein [Phycisphaerales bacterium]MDB5355934.1 hypothetical protein [Phycisphaerales bacterium]